MHKRQFVRFILLKALCAGYEGQTLGAGGLKAVMREKGRYPAQRGEKREEVFWLWRKGEMWYDGGVRSFGDLGVKGFREEFGFFSGEVGTRI